MTTTNRFNLDALLALLPDDPPKLIDGRPAIGTRRVTVETFLGTVHVVSSRLDDTDCDRKERKIAVGWLTTLASNDGTFKRWTIDRIDEPGNPWWTIYLSARVRDPGGVETTIVRSAAIEEWREQEFPGATITGWLDLSSPSRVPDPS